MTSEDKQTILSVMVAAALSVAVVGCAMMSTVLLTERDRPTLETALTNGLQQTPSQVALNAGL
jgi:hypothetical protein